MGVGAALAGAACFDFDAGAAAAPPPAESRAASARPRARRIFVAMVMGSSSTSGLARRAPSCSGPWGLFCDRHGAALDVGERGLLEEAQVGGLHRAPGRVRRAGAVVSAGPIRSEQASGPDPLALERLDDLDERDLVGPAREAVPAPDAPARGEEAGAGERGEHLREVVARDPDLAGELAAELRLLAVVRGEVSERAKGVGRRGAEDHPSAPFTRLWMPISIMRPEGAPAGGTCQRSCEE